MAKNRNGLCSFITWMTWGGHTEKGPKNKICGREQGYTNTTLRHDAAFYSMQIGDNLDLDLQLWEVLNHLDTIKAHRQAEEISQTDNETTDPTDGNEIDLGLRGKSDQAEGGQILEGATCRTEEVPSVHVLLLVWCTCTMDSTPYMKCIQVSFPQIALILCQTWQLIKAVPIVLHYLHVDKWSYSCPACSLAQYYYPRSTYRAMEVEVHAELTRDFVVLRILNRRYSVAMEITCACRSHVLVVCGGPPLGQNCDIHLTWHVCRDCNMTTKPAV